MARSLLLQVKREFVQLCKDEAALLDVQVEFGHPGMDRLQDDAGWINETNDWSQDWSNVGATQRTESFSLVVRFVAALAGRDADESEEAVFEMFEVAQDLVHDQRNFMELRNGQGRQLVSIILAPNELSPMVANEGRVAGITADLKVKGRI